MGSAARQWSDAVRRSLITLQALTHAPRAYAAAVTTSLPEQIGGFEIGITDFVGCVTRRSRCLPMDGVIPRKRVPARLAGARAGVRSAADHVRNPRRTTALE
jgi:hypothetical protein